MLQLIINIIYINKMIIKRSLQLDEHYKCHFHFNYNIIYWLICENIS
jgi:hypothetical protein